MLVPLNQWVSQISFCWFLANIAKIPVNIHPVTCRDSNCAQFSQKTAIYSSRYLQSMKRHFQAAILKGYLGLSTRLKTSSLDFPFSWHVFFSLVSIIIQFLFYFHVLHVIFIKIMEKTKELIFLAQDTHHGIS